MEMRTCRWLGHSSSISQTFCSTDRPLSSSSTSSSSSSTLANRTHCDFLRQVGPLKMLVRKFGPLEIVGAVNWAHKVTNIIGCCFGYYQPGIGQNGSLTILNRGLCVFYPPCFGLIVKMCCLVATVWDF